MTVTKPKTALAATFAALSLGVAVPAAATAQPNPSNNSGGVAGLVAALVHVNAQNVLTNFLNGSLNNNDVRVVSVPVNLTNVLNNNDILNDNTVTIQNFLNNNLNNVNVQLLNNALNNLSLVVGQVVGVNALNGVYTFYVLP